MILAELFFTFLQIGAFTFGGGYAMLPLIQEAVLEKGWLEEQLIVDFIAVSESTPGPFAVNIATYVGTEVAGLPGALCATLGVVLPSFLIILLVARSYARFQSSGIVKGCMVGLKSAVVGLIAAALLSMAKTVFFPAGFTAGTAFFVSLGIFGAALVLAFRKAHPIVIIALSALAGIAGGYLGLL